MSNSGHPKRRRTTGPESQAASVAVLAQGQGRQPSKMLGAGREFVGRLLDFGDMSVRVAHALVTRPLHIRETASAAWFIASVSLIPTFVISIPFCVIIVFQLNQVLGELGAGDLAGAGTGLAVIREIGPIVAVLVVAGTGATAICADLGARSIREEVDALRVMGVDPIQRLIVPRIVASTCVSVALSSLVSLEGLVGSFAFSVMAQHVSPGLFLANLPLLVGVSDFFVSSFKAAVFGALAGLVSCYLGTTAKGGPKGVGDAVNQTVVFSFMLLFFANSVITLVVLQWRS